MKALIVAAAALIHSLPTMAGKPDIQAILGPRLSPGASIVLSSSAAPRWSEYYAPKANVVVNILSEKDVAETVKYCNENGIKFLAQTGAHGWTTTYNMNEKDVIINMRGLNSVNVNKPAKKVTVGGGALVKEIVDEVYKNELHVVAGGCNCVGTGYMLGGGLGRLMGEYGLAIDNLLSINLVTAKGTVITVTPEAPSTELWWALKGAGHNFGIVTSYVIKAYPWINGGTHWSGNLIYTGDQVESVTKAIDKLVMKKPMSIHYYFAVDPSSGQPIVLVNPWYAGTTEAGRAAFKPLFDVGPVADVTGPVKWNELNASGDFFCAKGGRKPAYTAGMKKMDPKAFKNVWNAYTAFITKHGVEKVGRSAMLTEIYSYDTVRSVEKTSTAYPHRDVNFHSIMIGWYDDPALDKEAEKLGKYAREQWMSTSGHHREHAYINFGKGDESLDAIYGESWRIRKLKTIKSKWDPKNQFGQYFPVK